MCQMLKVFKRMLTHLYSLHLRGLWFQLRVMRSSTNYWHGPLQIIYSFSCRFFSASLGAILIVGCAGGNPSPAVAPFVGVEPPIGETVSSEVASFTVEQVERGRDVFDFVCGECHVESEFQGAGFQFRWRRQTAWDFYRTITTTMPENAPGALTNQEYVDVLALILEMNGYVAGNVELSSTQAALDHLPMSAENP
jgi:hypothetical protein